MSREKCPRLPIIVGFPAAPRERLPLPDATRLLGKWYSWAIRSRGEPVKGVARTIKAHWDGVLRVLETGATTALLESVNALIQAATAGARG